MQQPNPNNNFSENYASRNIDGDYNNANWRGSGLGGVDSVPSIKTYKRTK